MPILITGHRGFVGNWLMAEAPCIPLADASGEMVDLRDRAKLFSTINDLHLRFDSVIHLAAQSSVPDSFRDPLTTYEVNFIGTQNLFEALRAVGFKGRVVYVSSADIYGNVGEEQLPISEEVPPQPMNPYAVSKASAELLCRYWAGTEAMDLIIARSFNHIGPGQSTRFALADFAKAIAEMKLGRRPPLLEVGDLDVTRDFTDVRDVVKAYLLLLQAGKGGQTYNVCSGKERHLNETVLQLGKLAKIDVQIKVDPSRLRKASQRRAVGSHSKLTQDTGWQPVITWEQTLNDMLDHFQKELTQ
jgi:GDP-4-dehydro-6-deoxy-D-mannose reductase